MKTLEPCHAGNKGDHSKELILTHVSIYFFCFCCYPFVYFLGFLARASLSDESKLSYQYTHNGIYNACRAKLLLPKFCF